MPSLILICGLPGSGKTTLAKQLEAERNAFRFSADAWIKGIVRDESDRAELDRLRDPMEALQWNATKRLLALGVDVILDNGFWTKGERMGLLAQVKEIGVSVELHYLDVPKEELWRRIETRNRQLPDDAFLNFREELEVWWPLFQPPDSDEISQYDRFVLHSTSV